MAELNRDQRFLPCLLDRLRDDDPKNKEESRNQRVVSSQRYKEGVIRDLRWLFNSSAHLPVEGKEEFTLADYPEAERSVLNFGTRQLCGLIAPDMDSLERELSTAIEVFEPRISRHSVTIKASQDRHLIAFEMRCELWAEPIPEQLFVKTTIDLESGQLALGDTAAMDERLVEHYNTELRHLREMAGEFAQEFPKIAGRLALDKDAKEICPDPYVERLLEGFAYLAARIHLKLDAEFPRFTQSLLETVYPHYLSPIPSMSVVRFDPDPNDTALVEGISIPRGTLLRSNLGKGERTSCIFQTAHTVRLLPLRIVEARYFTRDIGELNLPPTVPYKAAFRIRLEATQPVPIRNIAIDPLTFCLRGADELPAMIYEQILGRKVGVAIQTPDQRGQTLAVLPPTVVRRVGFAEDEALLPPSPRSFEGYRLLREYFAFPQRYLFIGLDGLAEGLKQCTGSQVDLIILLRETDTRLENRVNSSAFELFCAPAINLFPKTLDRISLSQRFSEFHVVADHNRPLDFEIFEVQNVTGYGTEAGQEQEFRPFYLARDADTGAAAFYTLNRLPRVLTAKEKQFGRRSAYAGTEIFLSLVDASSAPYRTDLRQLGIKALCTNRHLAIQMAVGVGRTDFTMDVNAPVTSVRCLNNPTLPRPSRAEGQFSWRLISHLSLNYLSLIEGKGDEGVAALREMLRLYSDATDRQVARQIEGLSKVQSRPIVRRVQTPGPITFARGLEITLTFDETAFEGTGVFILGAVLEQFFAKYVSLNSFTETVIRTQQRGEIMRWPAQTGRRQII